MATRSNIQIVRSFCETWHEREPERLLAFMTDDMIYHDFQFPPQHGQDSFRGRLTWFFSLFDDVELEIRNIAETETGVVLMERFDRLRIKGEVIELMVCSVAILREGKITEWREYYDLDLVERRMSEILGAPWQVDLRSR